MKRKLMNVIVYSAMLLTACMLGRQVPGGAPGETTEDVTGEADTGSTVQPEQSKAGNVETTGEISPQGSNLEEAVAQAILDYNFNRFLLGECISEGHDIMDYEGEGNRVKSYVLTMYGEYGFEDGNFVKVSGSGVIPAVITHSKTSDGSYELLDYQVVMDGGMYLDSVKELFPEALQERCITPPEEVRKELAAQERQYAAAYLESIGRTAEIGEYGDYEHRLLTDMGVSVEVSNRMAENQELANYPFWIGNLERVEDGIRYLYVMEYDSEDQEILYTKYVYDTKETVECYAFDSVSGGRKAG